MQARPDQPQGQPQLASAAQGPAARPSSRRAAARRGPNWMLVDADAVLALVSQLRATATAPDLKRLRSKLGELLQEFEIRAQVRGVAQARVGRARTILAALADDVVVGMPWGADAAWAPLTAPRPDGRAVAVPAAGQGAAQEAAQALARIAGEIAQDVELQELVCVALALGFERRDRAESGELARLGASLIPRVLDAQVGADTTLSPQWRSEANRGGPLASWLPLWVTTMVAAGLLAMLYFGLALSLGLKSDRLYAQIALLRPPAAAAVPPAPAPQPRLAAVLASLASARRLEVRDDIDRSVVQLPAPELFEPGTASLRGAAAEVLRPVAQALASAPGRVQVLAFTDGKSDRSARYPSDWDLSVDQAHAVRDALAALGVEAARLRFDGRADSEPPAAGAAASRIGANRVQIILLAGR
jgi:type VI secretion system protein ImpK